MSLKCNYILANGEVGKVEAQKGEWQAKRGRARDLIKVVGTKESCDGKGNCHCQEWPTGCCTAAWSLHFHPAAEQEASCIIALVLRNDGVPKMKNDSFSGLALLERPLWFILPRATLEAVVHHPRMCWNHRFTWIYIYMILQQLGAMLMFLA